MELINIFAKLKLVQNEKIRNVADNDKIAYNTPEWKELNEYEHEQSLISPTPNNPPWNSWVAFGMWVVSVLAVFIVPTLFITPYIIFIALEGNNSLENIQNDSTVIVLSILGTIPAHILTILFAWFIVTKNNKFSFKQTLGWSHNNFRWFYHILILIGFFATAVVVNYFIPEQDNELLRILRSSRTAVFVVAFLATFTAPMVEEVIYRGILYSAIQRTIGITGAVAIVTALFAIVHVPQYWGSPGTILLICLLSLVLTLVRVRTGNLLPCIVLHTIFNGIQSLLLILQPYLPENIGGTPEQPAVIIRFFT